MEKRKVFYTKLFTPLQQARVLDVPFFLENFFISKLKYKNNLNFFEQILIFFYQSKIISRIFLYIKIIYSIKVSFSIPKKKIIIFDCVGATDLQKLIKKDYFILSTRVEKVKKIYINKKIATYIIKNFFKRSIKQNYLIALIINISPKITITKIDNSKDFYEIRKVLSRKIKFIAVQNAHRGDTFHKNINETKKIFIPKYLCFSNYERDVYKFKKANVGKFIPIGSIRILLALDHLKNKKKITKSKNQFDICLISEPHNDITDDFLGAKNWVEVIGAIAQYAHKLSSEKKLNLIFVGKKVDPLARKLEIEFYKYFLKKNFKIDYGPRNKFNSYKRIMQSELVIGHNSTLLREAIALKKKVLCCNFTGSNFINFPTSGICVLKENNYEMTYF